MWDQIDLTSPEKEELEVRTTDKEYPTTEEYEKNNGIQENNDSLEENDSNDSDIMKITENWECSKDEVENKQSLTTVSGMIKKGDSYKNLQRNKTENTILVLGNAGAGKTTFVQFMAGNNDELMSRETGVDTGRFLIEDGVKLGDSLTESFTIYPEQHKIDSETSFTDTPGFTDTRSEKHEIVATYVMRKYLQGIKNVKIVLLVPYTSLELGRMYKGDFIDSLENTVSFISDIDKYENSIALIATMVPNMFKIVQNNIVMTSDETIIKNIADFLLKVKTFLEKKLLFGIEEKITKFIENAIKLIDLLLIRDENNNYKKINIFRQPYEEGPLSTMSLLQKGKLSLKKTILQNINYTKISNNDIGYSLSPKGKNYLNCLLWYINDNVSKMSSYLFILIENHYQSKMQQFKDIYSLRILLEEVVKKLKSLKRNLKESSNYKNYSSVLQNFITNENIQTNVIDSQTFYETREHINSLELFTDTKLILSPLEWAEQMKTVIIYMKDKLSQTKYKIALFDNLSSYEIQTFKINYRNTTDHKQIKMELDDWLLQKGYELNLTSDNDKGNDINDIISLTILKTNNISCDSDGKLSVEGYFIQISEINSNEIVTKYCKGIPLKAIGLYAIHTIFIDGDLTDDCFRGVDVMIVAPRWEIHGKRTINIDGVPGKNHKNSRAEDGIHFNDDGADGLPGFPGGNGGYFIGIGIYFINEHNLIIKTNGGKGGQGQDGGNGKAGSKGEDGAEKFRSKPPNQFNYDMILYKGTKNYISSLESNFDERIEAGYCSAVVKIYKKVGDCGKSGSHGGNGGTSGLGGDPGKVFFISENKPNISIQDTQGDLGEAGKGGDGGKLGENGKSMECYKTNIRQRNHSCLNSVHSFSPYSGNIDDCKDHNVDIWKCWNLDDNMICPQNSAKAGKSNYSSINLLSLNKTKDYYDFSEGIYNYMLRLKDNENNEYLSNYTLHLQKTINEKITNMTDQFPKFNLLTVLNTECDYTGIYPGGRENKLTEVRCSTMKS